MAQGYLSLVLHAHLPFVHHPEAENVLEERWLFEAITETYIPLIQMFEHLVADDVDFRLTMSMTPPLISMLESPLLQDRYVAHLDQLIELAEKELDKTENEPHFHGLALMYHRKFQEAKELFVDQYEKRLVTAFKNFQDMGNLEIITCGATHGFFPLLNVNPQCVKAQINVAVKHYEKAFGRKPKGIWLPECGFVSGIDEFLKDAGIQYFFVDTHGIAFSDPRPRYNVFAPLYTPEGVAVFGRDAESSKQVWSSKEGYPGDPNYREYYKDIGYEREWEYIKPYVHPEGIRVNTGMKYWRITGKSEYKEAYRPDWAEEKAAIHADDFIAKRKAQINHLSHHMDRKPIVIAPYDAELYGHWWYEGPIWIDFLIRKTYFNHTDVKMITPSEYLAEYPTNQMAMPADSSWGYKGYNQYWLDESNEWIYRHLDVAGRRMVELADHFSQYLTELKNKKTPEGLMQRALNQAARELLLAQSSDWAFIMRTGTMVPYAEKRFKQHINRFNRLYRDLMNESIDDAWLSEVERRDHIFLNVNCAEYFVSKETEKVQSNNLKNKLEEKALVNQGESHGIKTDS